MLLPFETLEFIWQNLYFDTKKQFEIAVNCNDFRFEKNGVLRKYPFNFKPPKSPEYVDNAFGGYLIFTIIIPCGRLELLQTAMHGNTLWLYKDDMFPCLLWRRDF
jgi:hypothetical protein